MTIDETSGPDGWEPEPDTQAALEQLGASRAGQKLHSKPRMRQQSHSPRSGAEMVMDYRALRALIGLIAFFLVPVVYVGNWLLFTRHVGGCFLPNPRLPDSLSGYYYTHMRNLFIGAMCAMGIFLAAYRGYDRWDSRLTNVAGVAAICIALSPTMPPAYSPKPNGPNQFFTAANMCGPSTPLTYQESPNQRFFSYVHLGSLGVLFVMVFLMVLIQFTRTATTGSQQAGDSEGGRQGWFKAALSVRAWWRGLFPDEPAKSRKRRRNRVYVSCAGCIALCGVLAGITAIWPSVGTVAPWLLFAECGAFVFFGIAWYVKGAASAPADRRRLLVWTASRTLRSWLADLDGEPAGASELVAAGQAPVTDDAAPGI